MASDVVELNSTRRTAQSSNVVQEDLSSLRRGEIQTLLEEYKQEKASGCSYVMKNVISINVCNNKTNDQGFP